MHRLPRRAAARGVLALAVAAALAACGGGGDTSDDFTPQAPSLEIRSDVVGEARAPFTVTFYFSAAPLLPTGQVVFSLAGGSVVASSFRRIDDRTFSVRLQPNAASQGVMALRVPPGAYRDAGNTVANTVAYELAQPYDTRPPLAGLTFDGPVDALGIITGNGAFTLTFGAALDAPLTAAAVRVSTGTLTDFTRTSAAGQPDVYRFAYAPPPSTVGPLVVDLVPGTAVSGGIPSEGDYWSFGVRTP